ncbi:MAG: carbon-nitrogen hydrolase family protein, partial [Bacteroidota bacterium]
MKFFRWLLIVVVLVVLIYNVWASVNTVSKDYMGKPTPPSKDSVIIIGIDSGKGNIIGMQPLLTAENYASESNLLLSLRPYFELAKEKGLFNDKTVVVFPEYTGSWLVAAQEKKSVYAEAHIMDAMATMVTSNIFKFGWTYLTAPKVENKSTYAVFAMKAKQMAAAYQKIFSKLAKEFHVTVVAGSIVLPDPSIDKDGKLAVANGTLYNTSVIFDNNGSIISPLVKKIFPIDEEAGFTACAPVDQNPVFETPAGNMGVLVCADSWYPAAYQSFNSTVKIIAVPSLGATDDIWNAPWNGYNGFKAPADVDTSDYKKLTEGEAWKKYTMGTRAVKSGIHYG